MEANKKNTDNILSLLYMAVIIAGTYLRVQGLASSFEYDEIWTMQNWLPLKWWQILTEFSAPNNHPLNSLLMKLFTLSSPGNIILLRLPNLICGIALMPLVYHLAKLLTHDRRIALFSMVFTAFSPGLIYYSHCARGYAMVSFWFILFTYLTSYCIIKYDELNARQRCYIAFGLLLSMIVSCMTFPAVALFIAPLMIIHLATLINRTLNGRSLINNIKSMLIDNKELIAVWTIMTIFALWIYVGNYHEFQKGTSIASGVKVGSFSDFVEFINQLFPKLLYWSIIPFVIVSLFDKRFSKLLYSFGFIILFSFLSIIFAKGGPPRAYLPVQPLMLILAACGIMVVSRSLLSFAKIKSDRILFPLACVLAAISVIPSALANNWAPVDWFETFKYVEKIPQDTMIIYRACETLPIAYNINNKAYADNFSRINNMSSGNRIIFVDISDKTINGQDMSGSERSYIINTKGYPVKVGAINSFMYKLEKITPETAIKNKTVIAVIHLSQPDYVKAKIKYLFGLPESKWLLINCFLSVPLKVNDKKYSSAVMACPDSHGLNIETLMMIENNNITFYIVRRYE